MNISSQITSSSSVKHGAHCCLLLLTVIILGWSTGVFWSSAEKEKRNNLNPFEEYGLVATFFLYLTRLISFLVLPQTLFNFIGLVFYNAFPSSEKVRIKGSTVFAPHICFRVVTRGDFPDLVKFNVRRNRKTCDDARLTNFAFEVVTDKAIPELGGIGVREIVVPSSYRTPHGSLFKARALQYCLEPEVSTLTDQDWIVHLDEETVLTKRALGGILNFVMCGKHDFGQGVITYANDQIANWITTLADSFRVADDYGKLRAQFYLFEKPYYALKGSYLVSRAGAERTVSFDHGPDGSVAEDCFFGMQAVSHGFTFNFIEGEMWETSPFTVWDFLQQRKRWIQGIYLVVHSRVIPWRNKWLLMISLYSWFTLPFTTSNFILHKIFPIPLPFILDFTSVLIGGVSIYMYIFGAIKSFSSRRMGFTKLAILGSLLCIPFNILAENIAVAWGVWGKKHNFYVVYKELSSDQKRRCSVTV